MNSELYRSVIVPARKSPDGETPDVISVTQENNGFAIFREDCDGVRLIEWMHRDKNAAIERAVYLAQEAREDIDAQQVMDEQNSNYNAMIGASLKA